MPPFEEMLLADLFALAGAKNVAKPGEIVRVRYIPTKQHEAHDLLSIGLTLRVDATMKPPPPPIWYAGFTDEELGDGSPAYVRIGR